MSRRPQGSRPTIGYVANGCRRAVSLIELCVAGGIVLILVGLLLPGVQAARESARRVSCSNKLRQLAMSANAYVEFYAMLPAGGRTSVPDPTSYSIQTKLLPFVEEQLLSDEINFNLRPSDLHVPVFGISQPIAKRRVSLFECPSDGNLSSTDFRNSYRANLGSAATYLRASIDDEKLLGPFEEELGVRISQIVDGTSKTALFAERIVGDGSEGRFTPARDFWIITPGVSGMPRPAAFYREACAYVTLGTPDHDSFFGEDWIAFGPRNTIYNHVLTPNSAIPDCTRDKSAVEFDGAVSARSMHGAGVHVAFCDGSVRYVSEDIDPLVWQAFGTRAGNEAGL